MKNIIKRFYIKKFDNLQLLEYLMKIACSTIEMFKKKKLVSFLLTKIGYLGF